MSYRLYSIHGFGLGVDCLVTNERENKHHVTIKARGLELSMNSIEAIIIKFLKDILTTRHGG